MDQIEMVKAVVADHEGLIMRLLKQMEDSAKSMRGLEQAAPTVLNNESEANTRKMLNTTMNILKRQQEVNVTLLSLFVMLCGTRDFQQWQAQFAMKTGADPQAVLRKMFEDKLKKAK